MRDRWDSQGQRHEHEHCVGTSRRYVDVEYLFSARFCFLALHINVCVFATLRVIHSNWKYLNHCFFFVCAYVIKILSFFLFVCVFYSMKMFGFFAFITLFCTDIHTRKHYMHRQRARACVCWHNIRSNGFIVSNGIEYSFSFHGGFMALIQCAIYVANCERARSLRGEHRHYNSTNNEAQMHVLPLEANSEWNGKVSL